MRDVKALRIIALITFLSMFGWNFGEKFLAYAVPNIPGEAAKASMIIFTLYLVFAFSNLFSGKLVETYGCRKSAAIGILLYSPFLFALAISRDFVTLLIGAAMVGFGASLFWLGINSFITKTFEKRGEATGYSQAASLTGGSMAALVGGILLYYLHEPAILFLIGGSILVLASFISLSIPEKRVVISRPSLRRQLHFFKNKDLLALSFISLVCSSFAGVTIPMIPMIVRSLPPVLGSAGKGLEVGLVIFLFYFLGILSATISGRLSDVKGRKVVFYLILLAGSLSAFIIFISTSVWMLAIGAMIYGPFIWLVNVPVVASIGDLFKKEQALALAITTFSGSLGVAFGALISAVGVLVPTPEAVMSFKLPFLIICVLFLLALFVVRRLSVE